MARTKNPKGRIPFTSLINKELLLKAQDVALELNFEGKNKVIEEALKYFFHNLKTYKEALYSKKKRLKRTKYQVDKAIELAKIDGEHGKLPSYLDPNLPKNSNISDYYYKLRRYTKDNPKYYVQEDINKTVLNNSNTGHQAINEVTKNYTNSYQEQVYTRIKESEEYIQNIIDDNSFSNKEIQKTINKNRLIFSNEFKQKLIDKGILKKEKIEDDSISG